jgi:MtrB/PioB family decaheme-associated outer membrane protein
MRTTLSLIAAAALTATMASAQEAPVSLVPRPPIGVPASATQVSVPAVAGVATFGARFSDVTGDAVRYQRYRDLSDGAIIDRFRFDRDGNRWHFDSFADHVGAKDQKFHASFAGAGKVKASFTWDQIPMNLSDSTRTPYMVASPGVMRVDGLMQQGIQNGVLTMRDLAGTAAATEIDSYRHVAAFDLRYSPTRQLDLGLQVMQTHRNGTQPWAGSFAFNNVVELSAPVDTRTTDVSGDMEWANPRGMVRVGYVGSWFTNRVPTLTWDNPFKYTDSTDATAYVTGTGGAQGQEASWPDNTQQAMTTAGSVVLPGRTRMTGSLTAGIWNQNQALLPVSINSAIGNVPLPRPTAEAEARTLGVNYTITSRPAEAVWLTARYRYYDFDNRTAVFHPEQFVVMDQTAHPGVPSVPIGYTRQNADIDASFTPLPFAAFRVGYTRAQDERPTRIYAKTSEDTYRASVDTSTSGIVTLRGIYERSTRRGSGFNEELLVEAGEQPELRHFDVADRDRERVTGLIQVSPHKTFGLTASLGSGRDQYPDSGFGLRDADTRTYSVGADVTPGKKVYATATYTWEKNTALQNSRTANPLTDQVFDATRDWSIDSADRTETYGGSFDMIKLVPRTEVRLGYDYTKSRATYVHHQPANSTIAPLLPLPPVRNEIETMTGDVRYFLTKQVAVGATYWYDRYAVDDFAVNEATLQPLALPGALYLGSLFRPYEARTGSVRLIFVW